MAHGEDPSSSSNREAGMGECNPPMWDRERSDRCLAIEQLVVASRTNSAHLNSDVQPDCDLTRVLVDRRKKYVAEKYEHWAEGLVRIALGVVLMSTAKEINVQGQVHFLHLAQGDNIMRSHGGNTYLYENGAFRLFKGIIPESTIQRCEEFSAFVEGCLWCIETSCKTRSELGIYASLDELFLDITKKRVGARRTLGRLKAPIPVYIREV